MAMLQQLPYPFCALLLILREPRRRKGGTRERGFYLLQALVVESLARRAREWKPSSWPPAQSGRVKFSVQGTRSGACQSERVNHALFIVGSPWAVLRGTRSLRRVSAWGAAAAFLSMRIGIFASGPMAGYQTSGWVLPLVVVVRQTGNRIVRSCWTEQSR
jgi:hypothetical protein